MRLLIIFLTVFWIPVNAALCTDSEAREEKKPTKTIVVLFDLSESTKNLRDIYLGNFKKVVESLNHGDAIAVAKITGESIAEPEIPVNKEFPDFVPRDKMGNLTDNPILVKDARADADKKLKKIKEEMINKAESILKQNANATDILSSLHVAEKIFKNFGRNKKILVIMSDMVEESKTSNFRKERLTEKRINEIIANEKKAGGMPDLTGIKIYAVGAGTGGQNSFFDIQRFWLKYFRECGTELKKEYYGPALIKFNE